MELLFLNDNMKSYLRRNVQGRLKTNDWICLILAMAGMVFAIIAVS